MKKITKEDIEFYLKEIEANIDDDDFQMPFFRSLEDWFFAAGELTQPQINSLIRIYERVTGIC